MDEAKIFYTAGPTKFDTAPFGTIVTVIRNDEGAHDLYVQTSFFVGDPLWLSASDLLLLAYKDKLADQEFLKELLTHITSEDPNRAG